METTGPWFFWAFPVAFALHNIEEAIWMPRFSRSAGRYQAPVGAFEFIFAVTILTLLAIVITVFLFRGGKESISSYLFFAFNAGMLLNVLFPHAVATVALRKYCPGLLTGVLVLAPTTLSLLVYGFSNGYVHSPTFWLIAIPFAALVVVSIPLLFKVGRAVKGLVW
jgi:hypothetical protein